MTPLPLAALLHLTYFGVLLPFRTWRYRDVWPSAGQRRPRTSHYKSNSVAFLSHGFMSLIVLMLLPRATRETLFPAEWPDAWSLFLGVIAFAVMVGIDLRYSRLCFDRGAPHMYYDTPQTAEERTYWVGHSVAAGMTEELTWRGVQPALITQVTGQAGLAIAICAVTFGLGHVRHGRPFIAIATGFALIFHALTLLTGALYVPILVHCAVNVTVGFVAGRWVKE